MAALYDQTWQAVQQLEKSLLSVLAVISIGVSNPQDTDQLLRQLSQYRLRCQDIIFQDFAYSVDKNVEARLWEVHTKINNYFRKQFSLLRDTQGKRKPVEYRKATKQYLVFIKSSQVFYRGYIQRLASNFGGISELEAVAHEFKLSTLSAEDPVQPSAELCHAVLLSCHQTLIRLGDLSRYRETETSPKQRDWGPAKGYYTLAGLIYPPSGASHNQLAVIALTNFDHLTATFHLYLALAAEEPHPNAKGNLEIEFKKIITAWENGELIGNGIQNASQGPGKVLVGWFMRLHAKCYRGIEFSEHDELENEVLSQLKFDLKQRSMEETLGKFVLINVAAEYSAGSRWQNEPDLPASMQAFMYFQRLNVKTFTTLLQIMQAGLEDSKGEDVSQVSAATPPKISTVTRRVLPYLRQYSSWMSCNSTLLIAQDGDGPLGIHIKEMWKTYADCLTLLASTFPVPDLVPVGYLLEEDGHTIGFRPFENDRRRYYDPGTNTRKPKVHDRGIERYHPNVEMMSRIRDLLTDGLEFAIDETTPIDLIEGTTTFVHREDDLPSEQVAFSQGQKGIIRATLVDEMDVSKCNGNTVQDTASATAEKASASASIINYMNRMVDDLMDPQAATTSNGYTNGFGKAIPPTPPSHTFEDLQSLDTPDETSYGLIGTATALDLSKVVRALSTPSQTQSSPHPVLPSIYNSPFAPQPDDEAHLSCPSSAKCSTPMHSRHSSQHTPRLLSSQPNGHQSNKSSISSSIAPSKAYSVISSVSSMPDPSSMPYPRTVAPGAALYRNYQPLGNGIFYGGQGINYSAGQRPSANANQAIRTGNSSLFNEGTFRSSNIFKGSTWEPSTWSGKGTEEQATPPNGQGGG